ncbi:MAG: hypothetical protein ACXV2E_04250 [Halobacteriota archaeon]
MTRKTMLTAPLIDEICDLVSRGACDVTVCRILGIHRSTLWDWKRRGRDSDERECIFSEFYERYERACGYRTLAWIEAVERAGHYKWLLQHCPDTRDDWTDVVMVKRKGTLKVRADEVKDYIDRIDAYRKTLKEQGNQT